MSFNPQKRASFLILSLFFLANLCALLLITHLQAGALAAFAHSPGAEASGSGSLPLYLPFIQRGLTTPILEPIQLACGADSWTVRWHNQDTAVTYQLQEAQEPTFSTPTTYTTVITSQLISSSPSPNSLYYYRVRSLTGTVSSSWSNSISLVGSFFDDFTDPNSGWADGETSISTVGYDNGRYFIRTKDSGSPNLTFLASALSPDVNRADYIVEANIHWQPGSATSGLYGLIFGSSNNLSHYYFAAIYPETESYRLFFFDSTLPVAERLQPVSPLIPDPIIQSGTAVNHIRVERIGPTITLQINGIHLGSWHDDSLIGPTRAGLIAAANPAANPIVEARYDNFKISSCPGSAAAGNLHGTAGIPLTQPVLPAALFDGSHPSYKIRMR